MQLKMPADVFRESEQALDSLWQRFHSAWLAGEVPAAAIQDGMPVPVEYCVTTVARLTEQPEAPLDAFTTLIERLRAVSPTQYYYPRHTWHITLLGCTHRSLLRDDFSSQLVAQIADACTRVFADAGSLRMRMRGLCIVGNQCFVQGFPYDRRIVELRVRLEQELRAAGIEPLTYTHNLPTHSNILRITDTNPAALRALHDEIASLRQSDFGDVLVSSFELVMTDVLLSPRNLRIFKRVELSDVKG